ncbi:hypothetical protein [Aquitalea pelogenes]|uniref:hypothetical protein n=1 Tax=Aquitalea pelogenes TaxID=1293573 RepID=UPI0035B18150
MREQWLMMAAALSMTGCSYGDMLDTIPADRHQPYVPGLSRQAVRLAVSPTEQRFLQAEGCQQCRAADQFHRFIHDDPAVRKSRLPRNPLLASDAGDAKRQWVDEARTAVYFSRHIRLADGQSLFQLISQCSNGWDNPATVATFRHPAGTEAGFDIEYLIRFKKYGQPIALEVRAAFLRQGALIIANSSFAEALLNAPDFMQQYQLRCWQD